MNNVPYFLQHLPIWKYNLEDNKQNKNKRVKEHKYDAVDKHTGQMVEKVERNIKQNIDYVIQQKPVVNHVVKN